MDDCIFVLAYQPQIQAACLYIYNLSSLSSSFTLFFIAAATTPQSITCRSF